MTNKYVKLYVICLKYQNIIFIYDLEIILNVSIKFYLQAVERRGEMIVRTLEPRCLGGRHAVEAAQQLLSQADENHTVQVSNEIN